MTSPKAAAAEEMTAKEKRLAIEHIVNTLSHFRVSASFSPIAESLMKSLETLTQSLSSHK